MARKTYKSKKDGKRRQILIILGVLAALSGLVALLIYLDSFNQSPEKLTQRNIALIAEAKSKLDPTICDQIRGGLQAEESTPARHEQGVVFEGGPGTPAKNEAQTKDLCRKNVESALEQQRQLNEKRKQQAQ